MSWDVFLHIGKIQRSSNEFCVVVGLVTVMSTRMKTNFCLMTLCARLAQYNGLQNERTRTDEPS